jgi:RNA polymerase sigma factor (sigma-70 family)
MTRPPTPRLGELEPTDEELLDRARAGSTAAFAALWKRHAGVAYSVAHSFQNLEADDLVSEAFTRILAAIQEGKGPRTAFRPYLAMAVRNVGRYRYGRYQADRERERRAGDELALSEARTVRSGEDIALDSLERSVALDAFLSLPKRWQEVLWYTEVDGLKPRVVSEYVGVPANAVSALAIRAKRALRSAWITAQLGQAKTPECAEALKEMGNYARGASSARARRQLETHLDTCPTCPAALREAERLSQLTLVLLPAVVGTAGAAAYAPLHPSPAVPEAFSPEDSDPNTDAAAPASAARPRRRPVIVAAWVAAGILLIGGSAVTGATIFTRDDPPREEASLSQPLTPTPTPTPSPTRDENLPSASQTPEPRDSSENETDEPTPPQPPAASTGPDPDAEGNEPTTPPVSTPPTAPSAQLQQADERVYPLVRGGSATPGATVELVDEAGSVVGSTTARGDGSWRARVTSGSVGTHTLTARQIVGAQSSPPSPPMAYTVTGPPAITAPAANTTTTGPEFLFSYTAPAGSTIQREIVGVTAQQTISTPASGTWEEYFAAPPGSYTVKIRYFEPGTGDFGPTTQYTFTLT